MSDDDTVGTLLAKIAAALADALRVFTFADKSQWGPDEGDQLRALEDALDDAKKDFQEMGPLVNGQFYYENDRRRKCSISIGPQVYPPTLDIFPFFGCFSCDAPRVNNPLRV